LDDVAFCEWLIDEVGVRGDFPLSGVLSAIRLKTKRVIRRCAFAKRRKHLIGRQTGRLSQLECFVFDIKHPHENAVPIMALV